MGQYSQSLLRRLGNDVEFLNFIMDRVKFEIRCAAPGIIKSFDSDKQTVAVQLVTKERIVIDGILESKKLPLLPVVPIFMPRSGNFIMTTPIKEGDECLVVFSDTCTDAWWQNGGEDNEQIVSRRHDLSDAFAICGVWSQKNVIENYATDAFEIRTLNGENKVQIKDDVIKIFVNTNTYIEVKDGQINILSTDTLNVNSYGNMAVESYGTMDITSSNALTIKGNSTVNVESGGNMAVESDGVVDIKGAGNITVESDSNVEITGGGDVTISGTGSVTVDGALVNLNAGIMGVARIGDTVTVSVDPSTHTGTGTITTGSISVLAGG